MKQEIKKGDLYYYITLYKLEGHETWRVHSSRTKDGIDKESKNNNWPKITYRKIIVVDRISGKLLSLAEE